MAAFYPMYYRFPNVDHGWRVVLPGVAVGALGWTALQGIFRVYLLLRHPGVKRFYGVVILVLLWLYFSGLVPLVGALVNAVRCGYSGEDRSGARRTSAERVGTRRRTLDRERLSVYLEALRNRVTTGTDAATPSDRYAQLLPPSRTLGRKRSP